MFAWLDGIPLALLVIAALLVGLAPFYPEPHLVEKLRMLAHGELERPLDIFDLIMHAAPALLLLIRLGRMGLQRLS
ncbi:MAG TPA: RND transporter [Desulfurivibrio alkaliphilus]|uniref:RND transporter n=1 Tax=Desulfurivibrio alkaliphilus TaxID=427923 RepID=A0A7C2XA86_9BACT|nr:RND transporter [Desulfurivibrio alkaliphilus]